MGGVWLCYGAQRVKVPCSRWSLARLKAPNLNANPSHNFPGCSIPSSTSKSKTEDQLTFTTQPDWVKVPYDALQFEPQLTTSRIAN